MDWRDRYELIGKIGSGGSADVYEAVDHKRDRHVALKIVPLGRGAPARVLREVEAAAALAHPNVVALYDWFGDGEHNYIVSELVQGERLDELSFRLHDADVVALGAELLDAVAAAHAQGVVHRDIKPQNVMLDTEGHVKVMDFGIALLLDAETLTQDGDVIGTVAYMSPEQAGGRRVGPPSDVYSAGMVLYELLAGEHPLRGETSAQTLASVSAARLPSLADLRPDLSDDLIDLIDAACAGRPAERPSAADLADALYDLLENGEVRGRRWRRLRAWMRPVASLGPAVERVAGAGLAAASGIVTLNALPAYPGGWTLPLISIAAALWAVVPQVGLAWLLGMLAFPLFNVSASIGVIYLVGAVALFWIARARPIVAVWPALSLLLAPLALTLVVPAAACLLGRVRGPLTAAWAAVVTFVYLTVADTPGLFTMFQDATGLAGELVAAGNPITAVVALAELVTQPACLLQAGLWAAAALALGLARSIANLEARLWLWSVVFAVLVCVYAVVPAAVWAAAVTPVVLALNVAAAAVVVLLPLLWLSGVEPQVVPDEPLQGD